MAFKAKPVVLTDDDRKKLEWIDFRSADWRERHRARTVLLLGTGLMVAEVSRKQGIAANTVTEQRTAWFERSFEGLKDRPRSGAPRKLAAEQTKQLGEWAREGASTAAELQSRLAGELNVSVSQGVVRSSLKLLGFVWKRTRHSLKKKRNEVDFRAAQVEIAGLVEQAVRGEIVLAYVDEAGFTHAQPNRSSWTPLGEVHSITAVRGPRLNVLAALMSDGQLFSHQQLQTTTAELFTEFLEEFLGFAGGPVTVILDNASIHKAKAFEERRAQLAQKGLTLYFLPPYSPELNRIEKLWHKMKYEWMGFKARTAALLKEDVVKILAGFGTEYQLTFS